MKEHFTEMLFALDVGAEAEVQSENAKKAFEAFISAQKKLDGEASLSAVAFHESVLTYWTNKPIKKWTKKDSRFDIGEGKGACCMLDAVSELMDKTGERLSDTPEEERPSKVILTICVFGRDNASKKCTYENLAEKIAHQRDIYKWKFFLMTDFTINMEKLGIDPDDTIVIHKDDPDMFTPIYEALNERIAAERSLI